MVIKVSVSHDIDQIVGAVKRALDDQVPFATAVAINAVADKVKDAEVREMRDVFDRPTPWTLSALRVRPRATKRSLMAEIRPDLQGNKQGVTADRWLAANITGGARKLKRFEKALRSVGVLPDGMYAIPGDGVTLDAYGNMPGGQIVKLLAYFKAFPEVGYKANMTDAKRKKLAKGSKKAYGYEYFVGRPADGKLPLGVWQRFKTGFGSAIKPILIFVDWANYQAILDFEYVARKTIEREFPGEFARAYEFAKRTAR